MSWPFKALASVHQNVVHSRRVVAMSAQLAELIPLEHSVLDVGCGDGLVGSLVLQQRSDLTMCGVDVVIRPKTHIAVVAFDGIRLPFADQSWDTVLFCDVLHHTVRPIEMLKEAVRVARQCVVIKDHSVEGFLARPTLRFMDFVGNAPHRVALPYNYLTPSEWHDAFRVSGLVPRQVRRQLNLYPKWANPIFGRSLHFIAACDISRERPV